jgi:hypothetical protein
MEIVMGTIPRGQQGVAGSLTSLTRTLGVVAGATIGAVLFNLMQARALDRGATAPDGFIGGFGGALGTAGLIAVLGCVLVIAARRGDPSPATGRRNDR